MNEEKYINKFNDKFLNKMFGKYTINNTTSFKQYSYIFLTEVLFPKNTLDLEELKLKDRILKNDIKKKIILYNIPYKIIDFILQYDYVDIYVISNENILNLHPDIIYLRDFDIEKIFKEQGEFYFIGKNVPEYIYYISDIKMFCIEGYYIPNIPDVKIVNNKNKYIITR